MGIVDGKVVIVTGAGRGIGRGHAIEFARQGAKVVVNDLGGAVEGSGSDETPAQEVVSEIKAMGGEAIANADNVADWEGAQRLINTAVETFGDLNVLVNNAGILRDRMLVNMTEEEWDAVINVHLKGTFAPTRWAATYWREKVKAGETVDARIINTSSTSGIFGNPGQTNYGAAKAGIASFTIIAARELGRYGVRSNCVAPAARTRLTETVPGLGDMVAPPSDDRFDIWDPANVSPLIAYLASADCPFNGATFFVQGGTVRFVEPWRMGEGIERDGRWTTTDLVEQLGPLAARTPSS